MEEAFLKGKKVLFIGQKFYDYHEVIIRELNDLGAQVLFVENKFFGDDHVNPLDFLGRIRKIGKPLMLKRYSQFILDKIKGERLDFLFCVGGFSITPYLIDQIRILNPKIKAMIYFWDSFKTWEYSHLIPLFDSSFSFDPDDCHKYEKLQYLQLFYTKEYKDVVTSRSDIDILYIGSVSPMSAERLTFIKELSEQIEQNGLTSFIWLFNSDAGRSKIGKLQFFLKRIFIRKYQRYYKDISQISLEGGFLKNKPLSREEVSSFFARAHCILDSPLKGQKGLTIRTIESLAAGKKLLTTNNQIKHEVFFKNDVINVIDENCPKLDVSFVRNRTLSSIKIDDLFLPNWIRHIFIDKI